MNTTLNTAKSISTITLAITGLAMAAAVSVSTSAQAYDAIEQSPGVYFAKEKRIRHAALVQQYRPVRRTPVSTRITVQDPTGKRAGSITVDTKNRYLYLSLGNGNAVRYSVGVGRAGFEWSGKVRIGRKAKWPSWTPPAAMLKRRPDLPRFMKGGIDNPLGARALYLYTGKGDSMYRIHGTSEPDTIGQAVSSGCIRMLNKDVSDLYTRVKIGTQVTVL